MSINVIAIDGPAASGKSTVADALAVELGVPYVSTGNMYRAITYYILNKCDKPHDLNEDGIRSCLNQIDLQYHKNDDGVMLLYLNDQMIENFIRSPEVSSNVSYFAAKPVVREWLNDKQRNLAQLGLIVMEGRDIGTVIFPEAKHKFFLTASPEVRAKRRLAQGGEVPDGAPVEAVAKEIAERDRMDMNRDIAPLRKADDAILVDSSDMNVQQVIQFIMYHMSE